MIHLHHCEPFVIRRLSVSGEKILTVETRFVPP